MTPMLHTSPRASDPLVPEEKIFKGSTIYGRGSHIGHVTQMRRANFHSQYPLRLHLKHTALIDPVVSEEKTSDPAAGPLYNAWL